MTAARPDPLSPVEMRPIGVVRGPWTERAAAPRQPAAARGVAGRIELRAGGEFEHAVHDLQRWSHIWVIFVFDRNGGWRAKVAPPRSSDRRGVLSTRSPHRPNPIGMSLLRLVGVEGHVLHVEDLDILDGTPVLDIKPYVAYADRADDARDGWLPDAEAQPRDPGPACEVTWSNDAQAQLHFLEARGCDWLRQRTLQALSLGTAPHPYRRIKPDGDAMRLAVKDFRVRFRADGAQVTIERIDSGYKRKHLERPDAEPRADTPLSVHREFVAAFARPTPTGGQDAGEVPGATRA